MIQSMTGYGKTSCELSNKVVAIEIRSLNSKQLDIFARIPNLYKEKELEIRNLVSQELNRGKVEITINFENTDTSATAKINTQLVKEYYKELRSLMNDLNVDTAESIFPAIMRFPDALKTEKEELDEEEWKILQQHIRLALEGVKNFRVQEGRALEKDIVGRVESITSLLQEVQPFESERIEKIRERIRGNLVDNGEAEKVDESRFEQEIIYYLEKLDITEEKVRLKNHCSFFLEVMQEKESAGKKLGFIAQEMGREINTLGSKASHSEIQRIVVLMKDELEKIKEQLMNVL